MRDVRSDDHYRPRETHEPPVRGPRLVVACTAVGCDRATLMDPRPLFGARRFWPASGRSERFRCTCGSRETRLCYTANTAQENGPVSLDAMRLWL